MPRDEYPSETFKLHSWDSLEYIHGPSSKVVRVTALLIFVSIFLAFMLSVLISVDRTIDVRGEIISASGTSLVYAGASGYLRQFLRQTGDSVNKGDVLGVIETQGAFREERFRLMRDIDQQLSALDDMSNLRSIVLPQNLFTQGTKGDAELLEIMASCERAKKVFVSQQNRINKEIPKELSPLLNQKQRIESKISILKKENQNQQLDSVIEGLIETKEQIENRIQSLRNTESQQLKSSHSELVANLKVAKAKLQSKTQSDTLIAPIDGTIAKVNHTVDSFVNMRDEIFGIIPRDAKLIAKISVHSKDIAKVRYGQKVYYKVEAFPYERYGVFEGKVFSRELLKNDVDTFLIRGSISKTESMNELEEEIILMSGMTFSAKIVKDRRRVIGIIFDKLFSLGGI
jgi:membrane fusion protein